MKYRLLRQVGATVLATVASAQSDAPPPIPMPTPAPASELADVLRADLDEQGWLELGARIARLDRAGELVFETLVQGETIGPDGTAARLTERQRSALVASFAHMKRAAVLPYALGRLKAPTKSTERDALDPGSVFGIVLAVARVHGDERDVPALLAAFDDVAGKGQGGDSLSADLRTTLRVLLDRSAEALTPLGNHFHGTKSATRVLIAQAVSAATCAGREGWLTERLRVDRAADLTILAGLGRSNGCRVPLLDRGTSAIEGYLVDSDFQYRREAARASGVVCDGRVVRPLIELLEDESEPVRLAAHRALQSVTGLSFGAAPQRWQSWFQSEERWYEERVGELFQRLEDPTPNVLLRTLDTLASHRYHRDEIALRMAALLSHHVPEVALHACKSLQRIGSTAVLDALSATLESDDEVLVAEVRRTLAALTGSAPSTVSDDALTVAVGDGER